MLQLPALARWEMVEAGFHSNFIGAAIATLAFLAAARETPSGSEYISAQKGVAPALSHSSHEGLSRAAGKRCQGSLRDRRLRP